MTHIIFPNFGQLFFLILLKSSKQFHSQKFLDFLRDLESRAFVDRESHSVFSYFAPLNVKIFLCLWEFWRLRKQFFNQKNCYTRILIPKLSHLLRSYENVTIWRLYSTARSNFVTFCFRKFNPHAPDRLTPSRARCAEKCGSALTHH